MRYSNESVKIGLGSLVLLSAMGLLISCGGGGGGASNAAPAKGTVVGKVTDYTTGLAIAGASVTDGTTSATTAADGSFTLATAPADRKPITATATSYAYGSRVVRVLVSATCRADLALLPATALNITDLAAGAVLDVPGSPARVVLPANGLVTAGGGVPAFPVTAYLTPVDPSSNPALMPGDYTTSAGSQIESFGALEVNFRDNAGAPLNLTPGQSATVRIPVASTYQGGTPPATMPAFFYDAAAGRWIEEGILTLGGTAPNQYYEGVVTHFSYWNADQVYNTACITGKVVRGDTLAPVAGAVIEAQGRDYIGSSTAFSAADGTFTLQVMANSTSIVTASGYLGNQLALSQSADVPSGNNGDPCTAMLEDLRLSNISANSAKIRLTWGLHPVDLDSHLQVTDSATPANSFHVYYSSVGTLTAFPFAALDVDDTDSNGPEIITITRFTPGTYHYYVHHFSGISDIYNSPARVELTLNGVPSVFVPPPTGTIGDDTSWNVFDLVVDAGGNVTVQPVNTYTTGYLAGTVGLAVKEQQPTLR